MKDLTTHLLLASCPTGELKVGYALAFSKLPYGRAKGSVTK